MTNSSFDSGLDRYGKRWILLVLLSLAITFGALVGETVFWRVAEDGRQAGSLLLQIRALAYQISALEWQIVGEHKMSSEIAERVEDTKGSLDRAVTNLEELGPGEESQRMIRRSYDAYVLAINEEFRLLKAGDFEKAQIIDRELVDPAFDALAETLESASTIFKTKKEQAEKIASFGLQIVLLLAMATVGLLIWKLQAAHALAVAQQELRLFAENVPAMTASFDQNLCCRFANNAFIEFFDLGDEDISGKYLREILEESEYAETVDYFAQALQGHAVKYQRTRKRANGELRHIEVNLLPNITDHGNILGCFCVTTDITDHELAKAELEQHRNHLEGLVAVRTSELAQSRDAAEAGSRAKTIFLANMSHELRTPMNGVMGMIDLALRRATDSQQIDWLNKSKDAAQRMVNVVNDIIDFSKIEAERLPLEERNFSLTEMIDDAIAMQDQAAEAKGLNLIREIPAGFPDQLSGDAFRLRQILLNFLGNACKFSEQGTITVRVSVVEQHGDNVLARIEVEDQGIGIGLEQQAMLFQAFTQVDGSMTRKYGGSGLGLIISKRLANLMGGDVGMASQEGRGSLFWTTARLKHAKVSEVGI